MSLAFFCWCFLHLLTAGCMFQLALTGMGDRSYHGTKAGVSVEWLEHLMGPTSESGHPWSLSPALCQTHSNPDTRQHRTCRTLPDCEVGQWRYKLLLGLLPRQTASTATPQNHPTCSQCTRSTCSQTRLDLEMRLHALDQRRCGWQKPITSSAPGHADSSASDVELVVGAIAKAMLQCIWAYGDQLELC